MEGQVDPQIAERPPRARGFTTRALLIATMGLTVVVLALTVAIVVTGIGPEKAKEPTTMRGRNLKAWAATAAANPDAAWAQTGYGTAQLAAGDKAGARGSYERALKLDPKAWFAEFSLGTLLVDSDSGRARKLLEHAAEAAPVSEKVRPYIALGDLLLDAGDARGAKTAYQRAIADVPTIIDARVGLARALEALGDPAGALEQYRQAARYDPSDQKLADAIARLEKHTAPSEETTP